jgi:hypothetical protein
MVLELKLKPRAKSQEPKMGSKLELQDRVVMIWYWNKSSKHDHQSMTKYGFMLTLMSSLKDDEAIHVEKELLILSTK